MDNKKGKEKMSDEDPPSTNEVHSWEGRADSCDWRSVDGIIRPTINQETQATCWVVAIVRAVQTLLNIGVCMQQQVELSIQHNVNRVKFDSENGINNIKKALNFMKTFGVCLESQCHHGKELVKRKCSHPEVNCYMVDSFTFLTDIEDIDIEEMVRRQPVVALIPYTPKLANYNINDNWLYQHDRTLDGLFPVMHGIIIIGYGVRDGKPYWIIQNSWGDSWGDGGFAFIYRQTIRGRSLSQFAGIICPNKRGCPRDL